MKFKVISCNVFSHELKYAAMKSPHHLTIEFLELGEHAHPAELRKKLQEKIDSSPEFDAVLLAYGLCGSAAEGLCARTVPVVIPRSHDCCGILLGSRKRFEEIFSPMPSTPFGSIGFVEHGNYYFSDGEMILGDGWEALVEQYGEEDARYIYEAMHPKLDGELRPIYFIHTPEIPCTEAMERCREHAEKEGRSFETLEGSLHLIRTLLSGEWTDEEFLIVKPGEMIRQVGDWDRIVRAVPAHSAKRENKDTE